jgi:predicted phosphodiesterase
MGGKVNQLTDISNSYDADIYIAGHSHDLFATNIEKLSLAPRGMELIKEKKTFINSGTFLETISMGGSGYAERKAYPMAKIGVAKLKIYPTKKPRPDVHVTI